MHPCLRVDEIIRLVACELVELEANGTVAALACCCKSFEEPVLDVLWETQVELTLLLECLPEDTWEDAWEESGKFVSWLMAFTFSAVSNQIRKIFTRTPTVAEWADLRKYTRRMRSLELDDSEDPAVSDILLVQQTHTTNDPWLPRLKKFHCERATEEIMPLIPFFLSHKLIEISIFFDEGCPAAVVGSMITSLPTLCPNLEYITFSIPYRDSVITDAASEALLACNRNGLRAFYVGSALTEEAREVVCRLPNLSELGMTIEGHTLLPAVTIPELNALMIDFDDCFDWLQGFREAGLENLEAVHFDSKCERVGDFLEAFESIARATSAQKTLFSFEFHTTHSWNPNYRLLFPFTQLETLFIEFDCDRDCFSMVDDDMITDLARAMPNLQCLRLGDMPCDASTGITVKGLAALAHNCRHLSKLRVHFQADSIAEAATNGETPSYLIDEVTAPQHDCALTDLEVGGTPVYTKLSKVLNGPLQIFPRLSNIDHDHGIWWTGSGQYLKKLKRQKDEAWAVVRLFLLSIDVLPDDRPSDVEGLAVTR